MVLILVSVMAVSAIILVVSRLGFANTALWLLFGSLIVFPRYLTTDAAVRHIGIAPSVPRLATYTLVIAGVLILLLIQRRRGGISWIWIPFIGCLCFGLAFSWSGGPTQESGVTQLLLAPAAWFVGAKLASSYDISNSKFVVRSVAILIFLELAVCLLQLIGLPVNPMEATQEAILGSRTNGTLGHPNDLGKVIFFLLAILLPFGRGLARRDIVLWRASVACSFIVLAMTGGRAVSAGALCLILVWSLLAPRRDSEQGRKLLALGAVAAVSVFLAGVLLARFDEDPQGGARSTLTDVAWNQITANPWRGIGPNSYVDVVGSYDALTASGVPVHNAVLLAIAELGAFGAFCLFLPFLAAAFVALRRIRKDSLPGEASRVYLAALPGLYLIGTTGWGILGSYVLPMLALTFGLLTGWSGRKNQTDESSSQIDESGYKQISSVIPAGRKVAP